jgi:transcriptional regulator with XRE-family HTH domain
MAMTTPTPAVGSLIRAWRTARGKSQLTLSLEAGVSSRHLSFVETGRSSPSREMVLTLAETLDVPLRDRNTLLEAAGFAAVYRETPLDAPAMTQVRDAVTRLLEASEPNPTLVVNRRYDILDANRAALAFLGFFAPGWQGPNNVAELLLSHQGLRPALRNWYEITAHVVHRIRDELSQGRASSREDEAMLERVIAADAELRDSRERSERSAHGGGDRGKAARPPAILVPLELRRDGVSLDLFTTITTLGTPLDITLQELRIETLFPATAASRDALQRIVSSLPPG